jgi:hypothetical protein
MPLVDVRSEKVEQPANLTVPEKLGKVEGGARRELSAQNR